MSSRQAGATVPPELVELIAEASGIGNLPQNAAKYLAEDITFQIKSILLVSRAACELREIATIDANCLRE